MRPITKYTICAITAAAMAAPAVAASNYYLRLDDVKGEAAARAGGRQLEIESWSWGATNAEKFGAVGGAHRDDGVASPRDAASGMPTGKRQHDNSGDTILIS